MNEEILASWPPYEKTLASVRELSENATLRPAPRVLRCVPVREFVCPPRPKWMVRWDLLLACTP